MLPFGREGSGVETIRCGQRRHERIVSDLIAPEEDFVPATGGDSAGVSKLKSCLASRGPQHVLDGGRSGPRQVLQRSQARDLYKLVDD